MTEIQPVTGACSFALPSENPQLLKKIPPSTPTNKPTIPAIADKSPPPRRKYARHGQPKNVRAPIMANAPKIKRMNGDEPPRARNSFANNALTNAPNINPMSSGRMY